MSKTPDIRQFKNRRSACDLLRKRGVAATEYDRLITMDGDRFNVDLSAIALPDDPALEAAQAEDQAESVESPKAEPKVPRAALKVAMKRIDKAVKRAESASKRKAAKRAAAPKATAKKASVKKVAAPKPQTGEPGVRRRADGKLSVSQACLAMFKAGKSNKDVWDHLVADYGLDEDKAHYPSWYRSHFKRKGAL